VNRFILITSQAQRELIKYLNYCVPAPIGWMHYALTLRAGCSKAESKFFAPPQTVPFAGPRDGQNLISWRQSLPLPTNPVS